MRCGGAGQARSERGAVVGRQAGGPTPAGASLWKSDLLCRRDLPNGQGIVTAKQQCNRALLNSGVLLAHELCVSAQGRSGGLGPLNGFMEVLQDYQL
jgi:hypothetical protein